MEKKILRGEKRQWIEMETRETESALNAYFDPDFSPSLSLRSIIVDLFVLLTHILTILSRVNGSNNVLSLLLGIFYSFLI